MNKIYKFCTKDGVIKKKYIPICNYLLESKMKRHEVYFHREKIPHEIYECYTTPNVRLKSRDKERYYLRIKEICDDFNIKIKAWVYPDFFVELHGENITYMLNEISLLLGGVGYIR